MIRSILADLRSDLGLWHHSVVIIDVWCNKRKKPGRLSAGHPGLTQATLASVPALHTTMAWMKMTMSLGMDSPTKDRHKDD